MSLMQKRLEKSANRIIKQLLEGSAPANKIAKAYNFVRDELENLVEFARANLDESQTKTAGEVFILKSDSITATAIWNGGKQLTVLVGSEAVLMDGDRINELTKKRRKEMVSNGIFVKSEDGRKYVLTEDVKFDKPSPAASLLLGGTRDGRSYWLHVKSRKPLGDWIEPNR